MYATPPHPTPQLDSVVTMYTYSYALTRHAPVGIVVFFIFFLVFIIGRFAANAWVAFDTSTASAASAAAPSALNITALLSAGAAWSEAGELMKVGMVTASIAPNPMLGSNKQFTQTLDLATGTMVVEAGDVTVNVYLSAADNDLLVIDVKHTLGDAIKVTATVTNIRPVATVATPSFDCQAYTTSADVVTAGTGEGAATTTWYHHNQEAAAAAASNQSYFANVVEYQNLGAKAARSIPDGIAGRTFGGALAVKSEDHASVVVVAALGVEQIPTAELASFTSRYATRATAVAAAAPATTIKPSHDAWWKAFWDRSHVEIKSANSSDASSSPFLITRQFILQRYIVGLQARSPFPIKFNGMLFTANKPVRKCPFHFLGGLSPPPYLFCFLVLFEPRYTLYILDVCADVTCSIYNSYACRIFHSAYQRPAWAALALTTDSGVGSTGGRIYGAHTTPCLATVTPTCLKRCLNRSSGRCRSHVPE